LKGGGRNDEVISRRLENFQENAMLGQHRIDLIESKLIEMMFVL